MAGIKFSQLERDILVGTWADIRAAQITCGDRVLALVLRTSDELRELLHVTAEDGKLSDDAIFQRHADILQHILCSTLDELRDTETAYMHAPIAGWLADACRDHVADGRASHMQAQAWLLFRDCVVQAVHSVCPRDGDGDRSVTVRAAWHTYATHLCQTMERVYAHELSIYTSRERRRWWLRGRGRLILALVVVILLVIVLLVILPLAM